MTSSLLEEEKEIFAPVHEKYIFLLQNSFTLRVTASGKIRRYCWIPSTPFSPAIISPRRDDVSPETTSIPEEIRSRPATTRNKSIRRHGDTDWPRLMLAQRAPPKISDPRSFPSLCFDSSSSRRDRMLDLYLPFSFLRILQKCNCNI